MTTWAFLCSALSFFRIVIAACITHKFIHRGAGALWLLGAILAWISLLFTIASGVTLLLVVAYPANTYPREHAAAVVVFAASVVFARWTHIGSFYVFKTQHEEELASIMLRCAVACLVVDGCTLYTLNRNFELKTAENNPITDINDWVDSLQTDIQHHTQLIETTTDTPTVDNRLAHLWDAYHSLLERWKRGGDANRVCHQCALDERYLEVPVSWSRPAYTNRDDVHMESTMTQPQVTTFTRRQDVPPRRVSSDYVMPRRPVSYNNENHRNPSVCFNCGVQGHISRTKRIWSLTDDCMGP
ncbi:hypothetical protein HPB52_025353 [Rhipicephalus sanguineus]|uniref:Uncharacterized protein n=1 Tax=Rhipicephalus sanguineus TaxID=34632 RepID=A0A9D4TD40_RHISA|nr:hypothetical protein HPB52_025353 [Rhipicephalus sanguineus]